MASISSYELIDHGIENSQHFQECGTWDTPLKYVVTGIGDNPAEAIDDCLEQMASNGQCDDVDLDTFEARMLADKELTEWPISPSIMDQWGVDLDDCGLYYHVSIRYNVA